MYPYPTVAASNPRSAYSRPETVSAMHPSPKSASRREFGTLRPRKGTLKVYNHVSFRNLFDFAKHRSPLPATSTPACPGRQKKFRTPYAAASSFPSHPLALFPKTRQQPVSPAATPAFGRFTDHQHRPDAPRLRHGAPRRMRRIAVEQLVDRSDTVTLNLLAETGEQLLRPRQKLTATEVDEALT